MAVLVVEAKVDGQVDFAGILVAIRGREADTQEGDRVAKEPFLGPCSCRPQAEVE